MLRKLLIITFIFGSVVVTYAQKKDKKKKKNKGKTEQTATTNDTAIDYRAIGAPMPDLYIHTIDGEKLTHNTFKNKGNLMIMVFNPTCDHCQTETVLLEKHIDKFDKTELLLMAAPSMVDYLEFYNNVTRYSKYPKMNVGVDSAGYISKTFEYGTLPQINIYDKDRKLIKVFLGETAIDALEPYIE